jgi:hypothetical protein
VSCFSVISHSSAHCEQATRIGNGRTVLIRREEMKKKAALIVFGLVLVFGGASRSEAQVKRVQMHIAGYLCGN